MLKPDIWLFEFYFYHSLGLTLHNTFISQLSSTIWCCWVYCSTCQIDGEKWSRGVLWIYFSLEWCKMWMGTPPLLKSKETLAWTHDLVLTAPSGSVASQGRVLSRVWIPAGALRASDQCQLFSYAAFKDCCICSCILTFSGPILLKSTEHPSVPPKNSNGNAK